MFDVQRWVDEAPDAPQRAFRQAVQLVLRAIACSNELSQIMVMKGGVLLAIRHGTGRVTTDIDFSTPKRLEEVKLPALLEQVRCALAPVSAENEYALALRLQSYEIKPPLPAATFPTLAMRVGYAFRLQRSAIARLEATGSPNVVSIDYSFNEWASNVDREEFEGGQLSVYPFFDLVAEKLRSILQQPVRRRPRFQDVYDLHVLLRAATVASTEKQAILQKLRQASAGRVDAHRAAMADPEVIRWARQDYAIALPPLIRNAPPPFEDAYRLVQDFYESLPW